MSLIPSVPITPSPVPVPITPNPAPIPATKRRLGEFLNTHETHGWRMVNDRAALKFPSIADTHVEYDCPCNPGFHFTVKRRATQATLSPTSTLPS